jgi:4-amino-4-deoxy-L-arabinose transferase-like glycosyltransferase
MRSQLGRLKWAAIAWIVVFWRLGYTSLMDPDEAHYAELTREMVRAGNWLVPTLDGLPFIDKPFLFHWLQGAAFTVLGETEFAARLPSALACLALFAITRWLGRALFGAAVGEWGAIMFATIPATFALSTIGLLDMAYTAFLFGALACLVIAARDARPRLELAGYGLLALAVMMKGPVALVLVGLFCGGAWLAGGDLREWSRRLHWRSGLLAAALVAAPWFVWMYARFGDAFVQGYILAGNLYYVTQPASFSGRAVSHTFYVRAFAGGFFPWSAIAVARLGDCALRRRSIAAMSTEEKLLWLWTAVAIAFFSVARFKLDHYIFPVAPAVCLIAARAWQDAASAERGQGWMTRTAVFALAAAFVVAGSFVTVSLFDLDLELPPSAIVLPIALGLGGIAFLTAIAAAGWRVPRSPVVPAVTLLAIYAIVVAIGYPTLEHTRPTSRLARALYKRTPPDAPAAIYRLEQWRASLRYYAQRPLAGLSAPEDVERFVAQQRPVYVIMRRGEYQALRSRGVELREVFQSRAVVGTRKGRFGLRKQEWGTLVVVTNRRARGWLP